MHRLALYFLLMLTCGCSTMPTLRGSRRTSESPDFQTATLSSHQEIEDETTFDSNLRENIVIHDSENSDSLVNRIMEDHRNYYGSRNLAFLGSGFGIGAIVAHTTLDDAIFNHSQVSIQGATSDDWLEFFHAPKELGNGIYTLPAFAAAWGIGRLYDDTAIGSVTSEWGERSLRAFLLGSPPVMLMQRVTGAGRPSEGNSKWKFWKDNNGVSGHAFMGAIPFLTASQIAEEPFPKFLLYVASTAVPLSRISDGDHFASQSFLGWWMAWAAVMAVDATQDGDSNWKTIPIFEPGFSGMGIEIRW